MAALPENLRVDVRIHAGLPPHFRFRTNALGKLILQHHAEKFIWSDMEGRDVPVRAWRDAKAEDLNDFFNPKEPT